MNTPIISNSLLTESQGITKENLLNEYLNFGNPHALLNGNAGTGKTFLLNNIAHDLLSTLTGNRKIYITAPTNKALSVLKEKIRPNPKFHFTTVHKALKMRRIFDKDSGEERFIMPAKAATHLKDCAIMIIDEASMLERRMLDNLLTVGDMKILFVGDDKQINPVNEAVSSVFHRNFPTHTLTEIIRQGTGNPIIDLSQDLDRIVDRVNNTIPSDGKLGGYFYTQDIDKIIQVLADTNGTSERKYLAYTNKTVNNINSRVRRKIYGPNARTIEPGETVIFNKPFQAYWTNQELKISTCEETTFKAKIPTEKSYMNNGVLTHAEEMEYRCHMINGNIPVIHESSKYDFLRMGRAIKTSVKRDGWNWGGYYYFFEQFADLKYNHAITIHKSQGSTYDEAIIDFKDVNINKNKKEVQRLLYTGITRASRLTVLYNV